MSPFKPDTRLRNLYNQYLYMDDKAYYDKVRFYEQNENDIFNMRLEDSLWIHKGYLDAVFQIGNYKKYTDISQALLQRLIYHNISYFQEEDIYEEVLHKRACSFYHIREYDKSIHISKELLKLNPQRKDTKKILFYAYRSSNTKALKIIKGAIMAALLSAAFILLFEQIVVASFFPEYIVNFLTITALVYGPIFILLIGAKVYIDFNSTQKSRKWVKQCTKRKKQKK